MYSDVLLAVDGSESATAASEHAVDIATTYDATLHALYVIETRIGYDSDIVDPDEVEVRFRAEGESVLEAIETAVDDQGGDVRTSIRRGVPEDVILDYADDHGVDLIVLGARGKSAFKTVLLGSTSETVIREATVPVVLFPERGVEADED